MERIRGNALFAARRVAKGRLCGRAAMTLVELLVVISIIGALVGLLIPAVMAAREAARKTQCKNNLKQLAIGLSSYDSALGRYPPGQRWSKQRKLPGAYSIAWSAILLPYIEQQAVADRIDFRIPLSDPRNLAATGTVIPTYLCPSTGLVEAHRSDSGHLEGLNGLPGEGMACIDYLGISGPDKDAKHPVTKEPYGRQQGILIGTKGFPDSDRLLDPPPIGPKDVTDGLAYTCWVTECTGRGVDVKQGEVDALHGAWASGTNVTHIDKGVNSVSLPTAWHNERVHSDHSGGAHFAMCDGSVQFLSDETDKKILRVLCSRNGEEVLPDEVF